MKFRAVPMRLPLVSCFGLFSVAAICAPASITTWRINSAVDPKYESLVESEREHNNKLAPKRIVRWVFEGQEGEFLLADVQSNKRHSCVIYMLHEGVFLPLGGNDYCTWSRAPKLVTRGKKTWIEFRQVVKQTLDNPTTINEFTAHFQKGTGSICMLGLPEVGYESLRCPEDKAPDSK